jgi:hypothetical protein
VQEVEGRDQMPYERSKYMQEIHDKYGKPAKKPATTNYGLLVTGFIFIVLTGIIGRSCNTTTYTSAQSAWCAANSGAVENYESLYAVSYSEACSRVYGNKP